MKNSRRHFSTGLPHFPGIFKVACCALNQRHACLSMAGLLRVLCTSTMPTSHLRGNHRRSPARTNCRISFCGKIRRCRTAKLISGGLWQMISPDNFISIAPRDIANEDASKRSQQAAARKACLYQLHFIGC